MPKIVNPPKRKPVKVYGGSTTRPISIRLLKTLKPAQKKER